MVDVCGPILRMQVEEEHRLHTCRDLIERKEGERKEGKNKGSREAGKYVTQHGCHGARVKAEGPSDVC